MNSSTTTEERPWRLYIAIIVPIVVIVAGLYFARTQGEGGPEEAAQPVVEGAEQLQCERQLSGILAAVDPTRLGLSSKPSDRAHDLNLWRTDCSQLLATERIAQDEELVQRLLSTEAAARTAAEEFSARDAMHLRTVLLFRQIAMKLVADQPDPLKQAVALFDYVQRNVLDAGPDAPTMTPYEVLLVGRASAAQRTWAFAELCRQVELDAFLLQPAAKEINAADSWLVAVPIKSEPGLEVYLFDPHIGLPVPAASEDTSTGVFVEQPATLREVRADDGLLRRLDEPKQPYPFKAADLEQVRIGLIGSSSLWSNRVAVLDFSTDLRGAIFYDGLGPNRLRQSSLYDRAVAAGKDAGWSAEDLFVWDFPEQELATFGTPQARGAALLANYQRLLAGPVIRDITDPKTGQKIQWDHPLIGARHLHITGKFLEGIREYNQVRQGLGAFTPESVNDLCRESAVYWTTCCQYELGEMESVLNMAGGGQYPPPFFTSVAPIWPDGMLRLTSFSLARLGQFEAAAKVLQSLPTANPHGVNYLIRRWERLAGAASGTPATPATEPSPPPATGDAPATAPPETAPQAAPPPTVPE